MIPRSVLFAILIALVVALLLGCSSTVHKKFSIDEDPSSLSIDARQRVILVTKKGGPGGDSHVVCAEPSPDVLAVGSKSLTGKAKASEKELARIRMAIEEKAMTLGPRTQVIQLLRDSLFRACEAHMNGVIDEDDYRRILVGFDEMVITLIAIDGLTHGEYPEAGFVEANVDGSGEQPGVVPEQDEPDEDQNQTDNALSGDPKLAAEIKEILSNYYDFQYRLKVLFIEADLKKRALTGAKKTSGTP
jgi:hypothetical protein